MEVEEHLSNSHTQAVKVYDFKKALRLSMEQVRVLTRIHENFSYQLSSSISAQLRAIVQVEVASVEQMLYEEFINKLPSVTVLSIFNAVEQDIRIAIEVPSQMALTTIDRLLGGRGIAAESELMGLTPIETNVLKQLFEGFVQHLRKAWIDIMEVQFKVLDIETNPQFLQIAIPGETVIVIAFDVTIGDRIERMHLCIPYILLEPLLPKLSSHNWYDNRTRMKNKEENEYLQEKIENLTVPVTVELGRGVITIQEFLGLAVNDVLQLGQIADGPLQVRVGEQIKFLARPGTINSRIAVKVEHVIEGEGEGENE